MGTLSRDFTTNLARSARLLAGFRKLESKKPRYSPALRAEGVGDTNDWRITIIGTTSVNGSK